MVKIQSSENHRKSMRTHGKLLLSNIVMGLVLFTTQELRSGKCDTCLVDCTSKCDIECASSGNPQCSFCVPFCMETFCPDCITIQETVIINNPGKQKLTTQQLPSQKIMKQEEELNALQKQQMIKQKSLQPNLKKQEILIKQQQFQLQTQ